MNNTGSISNIADYIPGLVALYNIRTGKYIYVNKAVKIILGYTPEEFIDGGFTFISGLVHPEDLPRIMQQNQEALDAANKNSGFEQETIAYFEYRMRHKNGSWKWVQTSGSVFGRNAAGEAELVLNISVDITESKQTEMQLRKSQLEVVEGKETEKRLKESEERFRSLVEAIEDYAIFALDAQGLITSWNEGVQYILGYTEEEIVGQHSRVLFTQLDREQGIPEQDLHRVKTEGMLVNEGLQVRKDGSVFHAIITTNAIRDEQGKIKGFSKILRDVTEKKEAEATIHFQAYHDSLTGLANRKALDERFVAAVSEAIRNQNKLAILFLDLDRFKNINDTLGHGIGDLILKEVADRLGHSMRAEDTLVRLGGDEFIMLLKGINQAHDVVKVCEKISESLEPVIRVQDQSLHISTTIGVAVFPEDGQDIFTLLKNADTALYRAKDEGSNRYKFYNERMNLLSIKRFALEQDLRQAMTKRELDIAYQPFIEISTGKIKGVEALIRWRHPKLGILYPSEFIPLAEEIGVIIPIGNWVLKTVCRQGRLWSQQGIKLQMTVNLSASQFDAPKIVDDVAVALEESQLDAGLLELEITESIAMENIGRTSTKLASLKQRGIRIAIDDFGTGYSSLNYLRSFPVHKLKIDKTFIKNAVTDPQDSAIIRAVISMGNSLGLTVCVEGVEHKQQLDLLASMDCALAQGFYICKPLFAEQLISWMKLRESKLKLQTMTLFKE